MLKMEDIFCQTLQFTWIQFLLCHNRLLLHGKHSRGRVQGPALLQYICTKQPKGLQIAKDRKGVHGINLYVCITFSTDTETKIPTKCTIKSHNLNFLDIKFSSNFHLLSQVLDPTETCRPALS